MWLLIVILLLICVLTVILNSVALFLILRRRASGARKALCVILGSLSLVSALSGVFTIVDATLYVFRKDQTNRFIVTIRDTLPLAQHLHVLLVTVDRTCAIVYPLQHNFLFTKGKAVILVVATQLASLALMLNIGILRTHLTILSVVIMFVSVAIFLAYLRIMFLLRTRMRRMKKCASVTSTNSVQTQASLKKPCNLFISICGAFYCFNLPAAILVFCSYSKINDDTKLYDETQPLYLIFFTGFLCSCLLNPVIYILSNRKFR